MAFQREKQSVTASELLQALADGDSIQLNQCTITGVLDINRFFDANEKFQTEKLSQKQNDSCKVVTFPQPLVFDKCIFEENVLFTADWAEPDSLSVVFEQDVIFNSSHFKGQSRFRNANFCGVAGFDGCTFDGFATFKNAVIKGDAKFRTANFQGYTLFGNAVFHHSARFTNTHFVKGAFFSQVEFKAETDFSGVYSSSRAVPACDSISFACRRFGDDEGFWRFVKQSAQEAGYYQLAGEYFHKERCANLRSKFRNKAYRDSRGLAKFLRVFSSIRFLPELIFGKMLFGYGERPVRVLVASALVILICAFFFSQPNALVYRQGNIDQSFLQGLYFSTITFTTLGYGDLYPAADNFHRILAMAEAISGGFLMALFVVCLAKRFSRG